MTMPEMCSHCGFALPKSATGLRHYGLHTAHQESECLRLLHAEIERLRSENLSLAAGQCIHHDDGLTGDDHGNQYCAKAREIARQKEVIQQVNARCDHLGMRLGEVIKERDALLTRTGAETDKDRAERFKQAGERLQSALSRISYLCGEPNEMGVSAYDVTFDEEAVIKQVESVMVDADRYRWLRLREHLDIELGAPESIDAAIDKARREEALERLSDNARELGLDF